MASAADDASFLGLVKQGWIAGYPPWFHNFWIKPAKCKSEPAKSDLLHFLRAIEDGKLPEVQKLLPKVNPNVQLATTDKQSESLLEWAAEKARNNDILRLLIKAGASVKVPNLVLKLVQPDRKELLQEVLAAGADPNSGAESPLITACWMDAELVKILLKSAAKLDVTTTVYVTNSKKFSQVTPLMVAAFAGNVDVAKLLLTVGANANAKDSGGNTALDWAKISRAKAKAKKIIALLEADDSLAPKSSTPAKSAKPAKAPKAKSKALPQPVDFAAAAETAEFKAALALAKKLTKSAGKPVELELGPLPGAQAFRLGDPKRAVAALEKIQPQLAALGAFSFISDGLYESNVAYLVVVPGLGYRDALIAFETPVGQSIDAYDLADWLAALEKTQPFVITHIVPDRIQARFTTPIKDPVKLAKSIAQICSDAGDPAAFAKSRELYLWWD